MDPLTQGVVGAVLPQALARRECVRAFALLGCVAGMAPDLDLLMGASEDPLAFLEFHREFTHALAFIPVGALAVALLSYPFARRVLRWRETYLACLLGYATHGWLDACTSYGTQLFWPFTETRVAWNVISVTDPLFAIPLAAIVIVAALRRRRRLAACGLVWILCYMLLGAVQHQRAVAAGQALATARGHEPERLIAKPGFANLLIWRLTYRHGERYYVDAVRAGLETTICVGASQPLLQVARDLPWLDPASRQARDIERFRGFSDGYLAMDPSAFNRVIDIRYSVVPNRVALLWGVELNPLANRDAHARFVVNRRVRFEQTADYWALLTGEGCAISLLERHAQRNAGVAPRLRETRRRVGDDADGVRPPDIRLVRKVEDAGV